MISHDSSPLTVTNKLYPTLFTTSNVLCTPEAVDETIGTLNDQYSTNNADGDWISHDSDRCGCVGKMIGLIGAGLLPTGFLHGRILLALTQDKVDWDKDWTNVTYLQGL
jgi:hypothetical protein